MEYYIEVKPSPGEVGRAWENQAKLRKSSVVVVPSPNITANRYLELQNLEVARREPRGVSSAGVCGASASRAIRTRCTWTVEAGLIGATAPATAAPRHVLDTTLPSFKYLLTTA